MTPAAVSGAEILSASALILAAILGLYGVLASARAQRQTAAAQNAINAAAQQASADNNNGRLALDMYQAIRQEVDGLKNELEEVREELDDERHWQSVVREWYIQHEARDVLVLQKLEEALPGSTAELPPALPLPKHPPRRRRASDGEPADVP